MTNMIFWLAPLGSASALFFAWFFYHQMKKESEGTEHMARIASYVRKGRDGLPQAAVQGGRP